MTDRVGRSGRRAEIALAFGLAALAGWIDATTFLHFNGLFVSFMSGNTTELGSALGHDARLVSEMCRAIAIFVAGVTVGELVGGIRRRWERVTVLCLVTLLLGAALAVELRHMPAWLGASCLGLAMGMENACLHKAGPITLSLTYVTGTLVNIGRNLAGLFRGEATFAPTAVYIGLWSSLLGGATAGAFATRHSFLLSEGVAAAFSFGLACLSFLQVRAEPVTFRAD